LTQDQVRRFQIRFASEEDYYETMKIFSRAKIPTDEAGSMSSRRTYTAQPSDSAPQIGAFPPPAPSNVASTFPGQASSLAGANDSGQPINFGGMMPPSTHSSSPYISHPVAPLAFSGAGSSPSLASPIYAHPPVPVTPSSLSLSQEKPLQPGINVYEPRPSTAPAIGSWHLSQVLPPKRDLPFCKPTPRTKSNAFNSIQEQISIASGVQEIGSVETALAPAQTSDKNPVAEIVEPQTAAGTEASQSTTTTRTKKRAPAKNPPKAPKIPKTPAAKKPRISAPRKKSTVAKSIKESPVRNVEEIPKQSQAISSQADGDYASIDTRTLPARPDQCRTLASLNLFSNNATVGLGEAKEQSLQPEGQPAPQEQVSEIVPSFPPIISQDSGAKYFNHQNPSNPHTVRQPLSELDSNIISTSHAYQIGAGMPLSCHKTPSQHPAPPSRTLKLCNSNSTPTGSYNSHTSLSPLALLLRDPNFAPTPSLDSSTSASSTDQDSISFWALSEEQQVEAIDAFAVGEIKSPKFEKLCVVMEGVWTKWMVL